MKGIIIIGSDHEENDRNLLELSLHNALDFETVSERQMEAFLVMMAQINATTLKSMQFANDCPYDLNEAENS